MIKCESREQRAESREQRNEIKASSKFFYQVFRGFSFSIAKTFNKEHSTPQWRDFAPLNFGRIAAE